MEHTRSILFLLVASLSLSIPTHAGPPRIEAENLPWIYPDASYSGERTPDRDELEAMHHDAHRQCFIANSVRSDVITEIVN